MCSRGSGFEGTFSLPPCGPISFLGVSLRRNHLEYLYSTLTTKWKPVYMLYSSGVLECFLFSKTSYRSITVKLNSMDAFSYSTGY